VGNLTQALKIVRDGRHQSLVDGQSLPAGSETAAFEIVRRWAMHLTAVRD